MAEISIDNIEVKEDSQAKLNAVAGLPTKNVLFAGEFNAVVKAAKNARIVPANTFLFFKKDLQGNQEILETGDFVMGLVEGRFISADYTGGDPLLLSSYDIEL